MIEASPKHTGCPFQGPATEASTLNYNDYLKVPELLNLQLPQSSPAHHDELLFIVIHQSYELWFKQILHELENAIQCMQNQQVLRARHLIHRSVQIMRQLVQQIHLLETMNPVEFLQFRDHLAPASGFQSSQFREIEFLTGLKDVEYLKIFRHRPDFFNRLERRLKEPDLWTAYCQLLIQLGFGLPTQGEPRAQIIEGLLPIYLRPDEHADVYLLSESLIDFDEYLALWRDHHVRVVERVIGSKMGTGGSEGVEYLRGTTNKKCFPMLWEVRTHLKLS
mgnify:CR=1 FL=1